MDDLLLVLSHQIRGARLQAKAETVARELRDELRTLSVRMDRLALVSQTMWELLRERTNLTNAEIIDKMHEIDLRDGVADGKIGPRVFLCESCGHKVSAHNTSCIYCGAAAPVSGTDEPEWSGDFSAPPPQ
jgi:hypothetical protein